MLARGACPGTTAVERAGGRAALIERVSKKLDLMGWPLFRDQVLPALPQETRSHIDEDEYLAMKVRLLEALERCLRDGGDRGDRVVTPLEWKTRLELALAEPAALRVLDRKSILGLARSVRPGVSDPTVERWN